MDRGEQILERLRQQDVRFFCFDPTGSRTVDLPSELEGFVDKRVLVDSPLDMFSPDVRPKVVTAFGLARIHGTSTAELAIKTGEVMAFVMYDEVASCGCFVATMSPAPSSNTAERDRGPELPVRFTNYKLDTAGVIIDVHPDMERLLGWDRDEMVGISVLEIIHPDDHETGILGWISLLEEGLGGQCRMNQRFQLKSGGWLWVEDTTTNYLSDPERGYVGSEIIDVSDEMAALEEAGRRDALFTKLTDALPSGVLHLDQEGEPTFWNQRWVDLVAGATPSLNGLLDAIEELDEVRTALDRAIFEGVDADLDVTLVGHESAGFARLHLRPLAHQDGATEVLITIDDNTEARTYQQKLIDQAHRDPLTGLLSRLGLRTIVDQLIVDQRPETTRALLFIDLDSFKPINDQFGHAVGDDVLRAVGRAIVDAVRPEDAVARIGGDEFIVAINDTHVSAEIDGIADRVAEAIKAAEDTFTQPLRIGASIGRAVVQTTDDFDTLLRRADDAMYDNKRQRRANDNGPEHEGSSHRQQGPRQV